MGKNGAFWSGEYKQWHYKRKQHVSKIWFRALVPNIQNIYNDPTIKTKKVLLNGVDITARCGAEKDNKLRFFDPVPAGDYLLEIQIVYKNLAPVEFYD